MLHNLARVIGKNLAFFLIFPRYIKQSLDELEERKRVITLFNVVVSHCETEEDKKVNYFLFIFNRTIFFYFFRLIITARSSRDN